MLRKRNYAWPTLTLTYKDVSIRRNRWFTISNKMLYARQEVQEVSLRVSRHVIAVISFLKSSAENDVRNTNYFSTKD